MHHPQPGIFAVGTRAHHHLEFDLVGDAADLLAAVGRIRALATSVAGVNVVVGFAPHLWAQVAPNHAPEDAQDFQPISGADGFAFPATQHDLWLWLHSAAPDSLFNVIRLCGAELHGLARLAAEQPSFSYLASQDLTGFEDGTENPPIGEALREATIAPGRPCAGGSIALVQRWVHDLDGFIALDTSERERVFGRTLYGSVELDAAVQPADSHVSRVVVENDDGEELEIFRRSVAYGGLAEHGLMFVAFSADRARMLRMLRRMAGAEDGLRDRLTRFSRPVTGSWYVAPPVELLGEPPAD